MFLSAVTAAFEIQLETVDDEGSVTVIIIRDLEDSTKVKELRKKVAHTFGLRENDIVLYYENEELKDSYTLDYYNIKAGSVVQMEEI